MHFAYIYPQTLHLRKLQRLTMESLRAQVSSWEVAKEQNIILSRIERTHFFLPEACRASRRRI